MKQIVIDASCILAFLLNQEGCEEVKKRASDSELIAPSCISFEIGNAISKLIKRKLLSIVDGVAVFHEYAKIPIRMIEPDIPSSIVLAGQTDSYSYDGFYISLANQFSLPLYTFDERMKQISLERGIECL
jgi:predicted nucleic acid-binding protein